MLRITQSESTQAAKSYFSKSLERGDYYLDGQEVAGSWGGKGAAMLGLSGAIDKDVFCGLIENRRPDGGRLTLRTVANRRPGYDFTFDVPKSVSLLYAVGGDDRIVGAARKALNDTMIEIEKEMHTRVRKGGADEDRRTGNMLWADFTHFTSRPAPLGEDLSTRLRDAGASTRPLENDKGEMLLADPHLHVHVYAINATFDSVEGEWKAGVFMQAKRDATYHQAAYHTRLAGELQKLGYEISPTANAFEIAGVDRDLIERFSRRTKEVEEIAEELGIVDQKAKSELGAKTRHSKKPEMKLSELKGYWRAIAGGNDVEALQNIVRFSNFNPHKQIGDYPNKAIRGVEFALSKELERVSETSEKRILASALAYSVGSASVESVTKALEARQDVLRENIGGETRLSTLEVLKEESKLLEIIRESKGTTPPLSKKDYSFQNPLFWEESSSEQKLAVEEIMSTQDWVCGLIGRAGTGKTTLLKEVEAGIKSVGSHLIAVAPTAEASRGVLRCEGFESADTVKRLLIDQELQKKIKGCVLWVDEAGMLGNHDMIKILNLSKDRGAKKVVLAGDPTQIRSVPRGDALRFLEENAGLKVSRLDKILRQKDERLRESVEAISRSDISKGLEILESEGHVIENPTKQMYASMAEAYVELTTEGQKSVLAISPTHHEGELVTQQIREKLKERGILVSEEKTFPRTVSTGWTQPEKSNAASYDIGMIVQFQQNEKKFVRGERARVTEVDSIGKKVTVIKNDRTEVSLPLNRSDKFDVYHLTEIPIAVGDRLRITQNTYVGRQRFNNGDMVRVAGFREDGSIDLGEGKVIPPHFGHLAHGYVHTADASQAKTVDSVLIGVGRDSMGATDMRRFYVGVSRARNEVKIFTDDREGLKIAAQRDSIRRSATELVGGPDRAREIIDRTHFLNRLKLTKQEQTKEINPPRYPAASLATVEREIEKEMEI